MEEICKLPNGCTLYREPNEVGGHTYWSDEVGGGVMVWDTCLVDSATLLAALTEEARRGVKEYHAKEKAKFGQGAEGSGGLGQGEQASVPPQ